MKKAASKGLFIKTIPFLLILTLVFSFSSIIIAEELNLEKAIDLGIAKNYEIEQKREEIKELERQRAIIEAGVDWYVGFDGNYSYNTEGPTFNSPDIIKDGDSVGFSIEGGKTTLNGLSISSQLSLQGADPFEFEDLDKKYRFKLDVSKRLYPILPTQTEKDFIQTDNKLIIAKDELDTVENKKEVDWLENYLKLLRLQQNLEYSKISYRLALDELELVKAQVGIGEAGENQLLMAEISLQETKLQQDQLLATIMQVKDNLSLELGITDNRIKIEENEEYLDSFSRRAASINVNTIDEEVVDFIKNNNVQLREIVLNKDYAENELKWQLKDDEVKVDTFTSYNYNAGSLDENNKDEWQVGVGISYDFYDGGQQELSVEGIKSKIKNLDRQYAYTLEQLKLQLKGMINEQKLNRMRVNSAETRLEKARLVEKLYKNQLNEGLITENQYKQKALAVNQAVVDYKEAEDQLLITKLRIALFLGLY